MRPMSRKQRRNALACCGVCMVLTAAMGGFAFWLSRQEPVMREPGPVSQVSASSAQENSGAVQAGLVRVDPVEVEGLDPDRPIVALSIDDSMTELTEEYIRVLEENNCKATFFVVGYLAEKYPEETAALAQAGMEIGNHSYSHQQLVGLRQEKITEQVSQTDTLLEKLTGEKPALVRPPYGRVNEDVLAAAGHPVVLWSLDSLDAVADSSADVLEQLLLAEDGDIIRVHDGMAITLEALEQGLPMLQQAGIQVTTVSNLFAVRGYGLADGCKYTHLAVGSGGS